MTAASEPDRADLFLPEGYHRNPQVSADATGGPYWEEGPGGSDIRYQEPVYRWAAKILLEQQTSTVVDIGCGTGVKLVRHLGGLAATMIGVDQASAITIAKRSFPGHRFVSADLGDPAVWSELRRLAPDLAISADVIEHLEEPRELLQRLRALVAPTGRVLISTPDRTRLDDPLPSGPPRNVKHTREWSSAEFQRLLADEGFTVVDHRMLLPRAYSANLQELRRLLGRARRRMTLPDARSCQAYLLTPR